MNISALGDSGIYFAPLPNLPQYATSGADSYTLKLCRVHLSQQLSTRGVQLRQQLLLKAKIKAFPKNIEFRRQNTYLRITPSNS